MRKILQFLSFSFLALSFHENVQTTSLTYQKLAGCRCSEASVRGMGDLGAFVTQPGLIGPSSSPVLIMMKARPCVDVPHRLNRFMITSCVSDTYGVLSSA